jgi:hypothetical protein
MAWNVIELPTKVLIFQFCDIKKLNFSPKEQKIRVQFTKNFQIMFPIDLWKSDKICWKNITGP